MDWTSISLWIAEHYPSVLLALAVGVTTWLLSRLYYDEIKPLKKSLSELPCSKREAVLEDIKDTLTTIRTYIATSDPKRSAIFSKKASPRKLNDIGMQLMESCKGSQFLQDNKTLLFQWLDMKKPTTALDVEICALEVLIENVDNDIFRPLKSWVYNSPALNVEQDGEAVEIAVTMRDVCFVISLPLRDMYLEEHPHIE